MDGRVAILGCGKIGESLLAGLLSSGTTDLVATTRRAERAEELLAPYGEWAGLAGVYLLSAWARGLLPVSPAERRAA